MIYRAIGLMSGSSLDGLDIVFAELHANGGKWTYEIVKADCYPYSEDWTKRLSGATSLTAKDYLLLHTEYGAYLGTQVLRFIEENGLQFKVALIASHGHTTFHLPGQQMTAQLGDGAAIAAATSLPVVTDLRSLDVALGGQGAPIVPIGEKLLLPGYDYFLNLGGIANISMKGDAYIAFDICAANRVLNLLAQQEGKEYDEDGRIAAAGQLNEPLLDKLNTLDYYRLPYPKSLANEFGTDTVYPLIKSAGLRTADAMNTYVEHIAVQIRDAITALPNHVSAASKLLATGGGALNGYLISRIGEQLAGLGIEVVVPEKELVQYKEALIMALIGVLRWREENNVLSSVTGAGRDSVGGAMWMGGEF
ncbi:MAG: anhydro-N-acetylmuramic acid kinase [Sphingobacteriales bacterium]|nr:MAG: anhydro-N-acetylmuramic acid kinase [Sphingobacteriales bacterium]